MNYLVIALAVVVIVLLYVLWKYFLTSSTVLLTEARLSSPPAAITDIPSPTNTTYTYGIWLYVNSWNKLSSKTVFSRSQNIEVFFPIDDRPELYVSVMLDDNNWQDIPITYNFPIQKWVQILVSVDGGNYVDCYLDGKLVKSVQLFSFARTPPDGGASGVPILVGTSADYPSNSITMDASIANFYRWPSAINPQIAWQSYLDSKPSTLMGLGNLSMKLSVTRNNQDIVSIK